MTEPESILCVTCAVYRPKSQPRRPNRPHVCDGCRERMATDLAALPAAYAAVDPEPVKGTSEIRSRAFESKPPGNISATSLTGPGSLRPSQDGSRWPQDQLGSPPPLVLLDFWVNNWAGYLNFPYVVFPTVRDLAGWLATRLEWACDNHPAIDDFATDLRDITGSLRAFESADRGESVGRCPRQLGDEVCNTPLYVDPFGDDIQCTRCRQTWRRREGEWMHLRAQQLSAGVEAA